MSIARIEFIDDVDNQPESFQQYGELNQGDTYENLHIYRLTDSDGSKQYLAIPVTHDSYGHARTVGVPYLVYPTEKVVRTWAVV